MAPPSDQPGAWDPAGSTPPPLPGQDPLADPGPLPSGQGPEAPPPGPPPGYTPAPGYGPPPGYGPTPGYGPPPGYGPAPGYGPPPGYSPTPYGYGPGMYGTGQIEHPQGITVLLCGIGSLVFCPLLGPVAWIMGNTAIKEIDADPARYSNRSVVQVGRVLGAIATCLLVIIAVIVLVAVILAAASSA